MELNSFFTIYGQNNTEGSLVPGPSPALDLHSRTQGNCRGRDASRVPVSPVPRLGAVVFFFVCLFVCLFFPVGRVRGGENVGS